MRTSTAFQFESGVKNLQQRQQELSDKQMQLTTGKRVNVASDDPVAAARAERAVQSIARNEADQRAVDASRNGLSLGESALGDANELLQQARETLVAAGNGSYSDGERAALAKKLEAIRQQLFSVANRGDGNGGFVFGGQGSANPPFMESGSGVQFVGQGGERMAATQEPLNLSVDGDLVWLKGRTGNGIFSTAPTAGNTGTAWITPGSITAPADLPFPAAPGATPPTYTVRFDVTGGVTTYAVEEDGNALAASLPYTSGQAIAVPGRGMSVNILGKPGPGDSFTLQQSTATLSVFDTLDRTIDALKTKNPTGATIQQAVNTGLNNIDRSLDSLQGARAAVGETLNRMDGIESRLTDNKLTAQNERSNAEDLDMVQAISEFQSKQTGYDAALKSYAMVQKLSLFQYVNG